MSSPKRRTRAFTSKATTAAGILKAAARRIREVGWTKGWALNQPEKCLLFSITAAGTNAKYEEVDKAIFIALDRIREFTGDPTTSMTNWNDAPERRVEQVLAVLEGKSIPT